MDPDKKYSDQIKNILMKSGQNLRSQNSTEMSYKPGPGKWSKKEILGHLIDSAYNNHQRILRAEKMENFIFKGYDQNEWVIKNNYQNRSKKEIIDLFLSVNYHLSELIANLTNDVLLKQIKNHNLDQISMRPVDKNQHVTLSILIEDYIFHLNHHLSQIVE